MDGWIVIKTIIDNKKFNLDYKKLKTQIKDMGKSIETFLKNGFKIGLSGAKGILSIIGVITKAILKIGLTIAGITVGIALLISGALILSKAFEEVFDKNEQIKANLDYMKFALIKALEPAIKAVANVLVKIIDFLAKIMQYTAYIIYAWTGYNIFEKATPEAYAKYFEEAQENSKKTAKNAKEIKKQLAGFDEMNVLHDTSQSDKDKENAYTAPNINFSDLNKVKATKWLDKIIKFGKWVLNNWEEVVFTLLLIKMFFDILTGNWIGVVLDFIGLLIIGFKKIWESLKIIIDIIKPYFKRFIDWLVNNVATPIGDMFLNLWNGIKNGAKFVVDNIKNFFGSIINFFSEIISKIVSFADSIKQKFEDVINFIGSLFSGIPNIIKKIFEPSTYLNIWNSFKNAWNNFINGLKKEVKITYSAEGGGTGAYGSGDGGGGFRAKGGIYYPKLAVGGIINMPGRGVPYHGATIGERGAEAVVPLTDSQQMALLGEAIGKYITVNATIVNSMNGRILNRELQKIQNQSNFATNGR